MGYGNKQLVRFSFPLFDFGADANGAHYFKLPRSEHGVAQRGQLVGIGLQVSEVFACYTTVASVELGTGADPDAYAKLAIADETAANTVFDQSNDTDAIIDENIPAGTLLKLTLTQATDNSADTGQGIPFVDVFVWV